MFGSKSVEKVQINVKKSSAVKNFFRKAYDIFTTRSLVPIDRLGAYFYPVGTGKSKFSSKITIETSYSVWEDKGDNPDVRKEGGLSRSEAINIADSNQAYWKGAINFYVAKEKNGEVVKVVYTAR